MTPRCPTPTKRRFATKEAATVAAARLRADPSGRTFDRRGPALRPYDRVCVCGWWHLTSGGNLTARIRGALKGTGS